jgi:hypothetical protein
VPPTVLVEASHDAAQCEPYINHHIIRDEHIHAGRSRRFGIKPNETFGIVSPLAKQLEGRICEDFTRCIFSWRRLGIDGDGLDFELSGRRWWCRSPSLQSPASAARAVSG